MSRFTRRQRSYIHLPAMLRKRFSWMCAVLPRRVATAASRTCMFALATYGLASFAAAATPDILFIAVDDLRPALGCYGDPLAQSPHMDALARRGTLFRQAHCQIAVCSPSRWSLLTGKRPNSLGVWDLGTYVRDHDPEIQTLPQFFRQRGYFTQSVGKILHGSGGPSKDPPSWSAPPQYDVVREPTLRYATPENLAGSGLKRAASESADVPDSQYVDGRVCDVAIRLLAERSQRAQPFFLAVGFRKPHLPFCAPQRYWQLHDAKQIPDPDPRTYPDGAPEWATRSWRELEGYTDIPNRGDVPIEKVRQLRHGYYACVSYVDALIGRLLKACQAQTHRQVIVVLWGDHGFHLGEQGLWTKANNYEWATRVPLIIAVPGQTPRHVDTIVELLDVFPTLCELCDLPVPEDLEGRSRAAWWSPSPPSETGWALSQFPRQRKGHRHRGAGDIMGYALRTPGFRYVQWREGLRGEVLAQELYDHRLDPTESHSVADDPAHAAQIAEFKRQLTGLISP